MRSFIESLEHGGFTSWSYPFAFGYLSNELRSYLRGESTREHLTAVFAQVDMVHDAWTNALSFNLGSESTWESTKASVRRTQDSASSVSAPPGSSSPAE